MARTKDAADGDSGSPVIPDEVIDQLLGNYKSPEQLTGPNGLIKQLVARLVTRAVNAELDHHLGYEAGEAPPEGQSNRRTGKTTKTLRSEVDRFRSKSLAIAMAASSHKSWVSTSVTSVASTIRSCRCTRGA
jgi:Transposase, Mutator family